MKSWLNARILIAEIVDAEVAETSTGQRLLRLAQSFYESLCSLLLDEQPTVGAALYHRLADLRGAVNFVEHGTEVRWLDHALLRARASEPIVTEWSNCLSSATTDKQLLELALLADQGEAHAWLQAEIEGGLKSGVGYAQARALTLLGFQDNQQAGDTLAEWGAGASGIWTAEVARAAAPSDGEPISGRSIGLGDSFPRTAISTRWLPWNCSRNARIDATTAGGHDFWKRMAVRTDGV